MGILFGLRRNRRPRPAESTANSGRIQASRVGFGWSSYGTRQGPLRAPTLAFGNWVAKGDRDASFVRGRQAGRVQRAAGYRARTHARSQAQAVGERRSGTPSCGSKPPRSRCGRSVGIGSGSERPGTSSSSRLGGGAAGGGRAGRAASVGGLRCLSILGAASLMRPTRSLRVSFSSLLRDGLRRHRVRLRRRVSSSPQKSRIVNSRAQLPLGDGAIPPLPACWSRADAMAASPARSEGRDAPTQPPPKSAYIPNRTRVTQLEEGLGPFRTRARRSRFVQKSEYRLRCGP